MKTKTITSILTLLTLGLCQMSMSAQEYYFGNSDWSEKSPQFPIVEINFQDWNFDDGAGYGLKTENDLGGCAENSRDDKDMYSSFKVNVPIDAKQGVNGSLEFDLEFCLIQKACDTQSGTYNTLYGEASGYHASNNNVSVAALAIYDNYQNYRDSTLGYNGDGSGAFTTSKISSLERIQYTTSSYGKKRGFHLEVGFEYENVIYWDTVRYITGSASTCRPDAVFDEVDGLIQDESNAGWVFEEKFDPSTYKNVYLRFRPTSDNRQIVRIHDLKIYGTMLQEDAIIAAITETKNDDNLIQGHNGLYTSTEPTNIRVYDITGKVVSQFTNTTSYDIRDLNSGLYIIKAINNNGNSAIRKIIL